MGPAGAKVHHGAIACRKPDAGGLRGHQRRERDRREQVGLDELGLFDRCLDAQHRLPGEHRGSFAHRPHVAGEMEALQVLEETVRQPAKRLDAAEGRDLLLAEVQTEQVRQSRFETRGKEEIAPWGKLPEPQFEGTSHAGPVLPVRSQHGELVQVSDEPQFVFTRQQRIRSSHGSPTERNTVSGGAKGSPTGSPKGPSSVQCRGGRQVPPGAPARATTTRSPSGSAWARS